MNDEIDSAFSSPFNGRSQESANRSHMAPEPDAAKAEAHFERALALARAAGKILGVACGDEYGAALGPIYGWFRLRMG